MHQWVKSADEAITSTRRNVLNIFLTTNSKHKHQNHVNEHPCQIRVCLSTLGHYALRGIRAAEATLALNVVQIPEC